MGKRRKAEHKIFKRIYLYGGATVFWITQNQAIAKAMYELEASGRVVRLKDHPRGRYPYCVYGIKTKRLQSEYGENRKLSLQQWQTEYLGCPNGCDHEFAPVPPHGYMHCKYCNAPQPHNKVFLGDAPSLAVK